MGIARLNRFLRKYCQPCLYKISLKSLSGKTLAIDTSIYLYKFKAKGSIITHMYVMCAIFKHYNIKPIFVFDGKPPPEKKNIIDMRKEKKEEAEREHKQIEEQLLSTSDPHKKRELMLKLNKLEKKFIRIKNKEVRDVKALFSSYGISYIEADGEADLLCAKLVESGYAYACLSEDMDMFAYGCPLVIRYFSLRGQTGVMYDLSKILTTLNLSMLEFKSLCILSGSDYHYNSNLYIKPISYYYERLRDYKKNNRTRGDFYNWLCDREMPPLTKDEFVNGHALFNISSLKIESKMIKNHYLQPNKLKELLRTENFIFPPES